MAPKYQRAIINTLEWCLPINARRAGKSFRYATTMQRNSAIGWLVCSPDQVNHPACPAARCRLGGTAWDDPMFHSGRGADQLPFTLKPLPVLS